jgi:hypothetical protein
VSGDRGDGEVKSLIKSGEAPQAALAPWRGNDHQLQVAAAKEVGLDPRAAELEIFTQAFRHATVVDDPSDHSIVIRGRTVLKAAEFERALRPVLRYLQVGSDLVTLLVHDARFEVRVHARAAEAAPAAMSEAKQVLWIWLACSMVGFTALAQSMRWAAFLLWTFGLLYGGYRLRKAVVSGRAMLAGRLALSLAMMAQEEKLILPPGDTPGLTTGTET